MPPRCEILYNEGIRRNDSALHSLYRSVYYIALQMESESTFDANIIYRNHQTHYQFINFKVIIFHVPFN